MSIDDMKEAIEKLRAVELRHAVRGVDATQVRDILDEAAETLAGAARKQTELRDELERLQAANDESAIGKALLTAAHAGEALVAEARETAASITAEAEAEASALLNKITERAQEQEQEIMTAREAFESDIAAAKTALENEHESARAEAEAALARARQELDGLENEATQLRALVADMERRILQIAQSALKELEAFGVSETRAAESDLLSDLRPEPEPERSDVART